MEEYLPKLLKDDSLIAYTFYIVIRYMYMYIICIYDISIL